MRVCLCFLVPAVLVGCGLLDALQGKGGKETSGSKDKVVVEIVEGGEDMPGKAKIMSDGKPLWPPEGPGCDRLVECCNSASRDSSAVGLACQLSVAEKPQDCVKALDSVRGIISELGLKTPGECK